MLKVLNILAIAYLAVAPGMNVDRLIHSVSLCRYTEPVQVAQADHCGHNHAPKPEPQQKECPHFDSDTPLATAMPVVHAQPEIAAALPVLNPPVLEIALPASAGRTSEDDPRPPPGPEHLRTVILLV
jgi:hypothetical protein